MSWAFYLFVVAEVVVVWRYAVVVWFVKVMAVDRKFSKTQ